MRFDCGIHPWDVERYTMPELDDLARESREREQARREAMTNGPQP